ncbi:hypothetical protein WIV_gp173 [Wiseana iridescent virus]|uniref:Uncharacterized protein n=1 Tax=Wiseana iridescent virus TaxID=68347 RepID=G0T5J9_IRV9|nr:hypothetical protein WIV_gp173 [Wiseana iridescent virus]ADO00517.1 hypothetical protein [Wiseana iridescent virus]
MESITLTFGGMGHTKFSVSSTQNKYTSDFLLPIVIEENGPEGYTVNIFGAENLESVFPVFKATETSFFKFKHSDKFSQCLRVKSGGQISSFPIENNVYGLEILNEKKQKMFESAGGHHQKNLTVWFGVDEGEDECGIYLFPRRTQTDGGFRGRTQTDGGFRGRTQTDDDIETDGGFTETDCMHLQSDGPKKATIALNNTSNEKFKSSYFKEPRTMNKRTFSFLFHQKKMVGNLYLN